MWPDFSGGGEGGGGGSTSIILYSTVLSSWYILIDVFATSTEMNLVLIFWNILIDLETLYVISEL